MNTVLSAEGLTKSFGKKLAVNNVCFSVKRGEIYGLIGRNGAGKTTILKMIGGLIRPSSGHLSLFGMTGAEIEKSGVLKKVGTLIEAPGLHSSLTAYQNIEMKCICGGIDYSEEYIMNLLSLVGLSAEAKKKCGVFSLGMKQRLGIALALVGDPELLVLDEPINGLDPQGIAEIRGILARLHREKDVTIIISSHILEELSKIVTNYGIIDKGVIVKEISRDELEHECSERVEIRTDEPEKSAALLRELGYSSARTRDGVAELSEGIDSTPKIISALCQKGLPPRTVEIKGKNIEDFYFDLVGGKDRD